MEIKKATKDKLRQVLDFLNKESDEAIGSYLYKGFRIQVSKYKQSGSERVLQLYNRRRRNGQCIACGIKVKRKNPLTKKLYRLCDAHRKKIDRKK